MYYPFYNNPFYYPSGAYMANMCSYGYCTDYNKNINVDNSSPLNNEASNNSRSSEKENDFFSLNGDRLEIFGISINIDDLIILIMLFFMFRENHVDYSIIIILALILFDQG